MIRRKLTYLTFALTILLGLAGCSSDEPSLPGKEPAADTYLQLSVSTVEAPSPASRAEYPTGYPYDFEGPAGDNEKIQTMRFLIMDQAGYLEHNVFIDQTTTPDVKAETAAYRVKPNQTKHIYLVGNEASLPEDYRTRLASLSYGDKFPTDEDLNYVLTRQADAPLFQPGQLIPMTEFHDFYVGGPQYDEVTGDSIPWSADLFVTRAATKFTFTLNIELDPSYNLDNLDVRPFIIESIATKEYLFPKATEYSPVKSNIFVDRIITSYSVPTPNELMPYTLNWTRGTDMLHYTAGPVYLPETQFNGEYAITVPIDDVELKSVLPNLPTLPRNTWVKVNITVRGPQVVCEVTLVPYIGIVLEPGFGLNRPEKK